ncbi:zeta toxin family protein [Runella slithyformis]|uniref:Zeta toxin domain-containing protein n=1 Tax=Runella slithyformis (strain ATCC 29530 / DSM 19594 / LMG 11500 / NCIMB 11436 / LSU 4) TaxID=761193 RepID=A0A7U3ZMS2_RUNSL|nr:zeta toxin family protein [Runella slithyformis]AEI50085.1 hypothetical protein Runsl_3727 [Runella slithyformis DSM 19594]
MAQRRLRIFAGPNGSGKSTIKSVIAKSLLGHYLNPDDIEKEVRERDFFDTGGLNIQISKKEVIAFFANHPLIHRTPNGDFVESIGYAEKGFIDFHNVGFDSYLSAILTDFLRHKFLDTGQSFTFETVMSSSDKIQILQKAQDEGYKTYLYYVATEDPAINLMRISHRVKMGGHDVPEDKAISRYYRSLDLLFEAIKHTNRAFIFDNSGESKTWIAEIVNGTEVQLQVDEVPLWFQRYVLDKL